MMSLCFLKCNQPTNHSVFLQHAYVVMTLLCRSRIKTASTLFTLILPNGKCFHWILCNICFACWSGWCCISNIRNQSYPVMDCWELAICSFSCYHGLDSHTPGHGVIIFSLFFTHSQKLIMQYCFTYLAWTKFMQLCLERDWASCQKCTSGKTGTLIYFLNNILVSIFHLTECPMLQKTMESFIIILSATQLFYILAIHGASAHRR